MAVSVDKTERDDAIVALYKSGKTLKLIGLRYGISAQAVSLILKKKGEAYGGRAVLAAKKRLAEDAACMAKYGCTCLEYEELKTLGRTMEALGSSHDRTPIGAYARQRANAQRRRIGWEINLWDWWTVWKDSGHWTKRGPEGYVMCRVGDKGPYRKGNVFIGTYAQNILEGFVTNGSGGLPRGVFQYKPTKTGEVHYGAKMFRFGRSISLGRYKTPEEAATALAAKMVSKRTIR